MATSTEVRVPVESLSQVRRKAVSIAVVGTPNSGKSTLFNRLTGLSQRTANYPGVTVERHVGYLHGTGGMVELVDLPGTHGLSPYSIEEGVAVSAVFGLLEGSGPPAGVLAVVDASNLYQGLFLLQQLLELELPVVVALTMTDAAAAAGTAVDAARLSERLGGVPVIPTVATTGKGMSRLVEAVSSLAEQEPARPVAGIWPEFAAATVPLAAETGVSRALLARALIAPDSAPAAAAFSRLGSDQQTALAAAGEELFAGVPPLAAEARARYAWAREARAAVLRQGAATPTLLDRAAGFLNRPWPGTIGLFAVMLVVFQAVFAWATPFMELIDGATAGLASASHAAFGDGLVASLIADGVIAGVGSVVIFLPQILILFLFIIVLEDSGYLARAAYLMDRAMRSVGLSGQSIIPMISSFACAVPGIMATRVIPQRRDRVATILAAPFMTCSARLPVYALLIAAFVPRHSIGPLNLQGLVLFGLYAFGILMGIVTALLIRRTALRGPRPAFALMLPEFRRPNVRTVAFALLGRVKVFLYRAGTVIFAVAVLIWALAYFPRLDDADARAAEFVSGLPAELDVEARAAAAADFRNRLAAEQLEQSVLGRMGHIVEPVFAPLGWDWRVSAAVIAGFPAREVVVAVLGTVYAVGSEADDATLAERLRASTWPDGSAVFTLPMVIGLLIFYAMCLQCAATLAVIRRETNSWRWPVFAWVYMTALGYLGALLAFQLGS